MRLFPLWHRTLFSQAFQVFIFFILCFYALYVLIDYSVHAKSFNQAHFSLHDLAFYYGSHFTKRAPVIIPFALMLATIKVLSGMNVKRELVAFLAAGFSPQRLMIPFCTLALLSITLLYLNAQFFLPKAEYFLKDIEKNYVEKKLDTKEPTLFSIQMKDHSTLIYQSYNKESKVFFDLFWLPNNDHIFRIKYLDATNTIPKGFFVDELVRNANGQFTKKDSFEEKEFPLLHLDEEVMQEVVTAPAAESLTELFHELLKNDENPELIANFSYKLLMPLIVFIVIFIPAPYCMRYSKNPPLFFIYALSIAGFVFLITLMDAAFIVAENQLLPPFLSLLIPLLLIYFLAFHHYFLLKKI